MRALFSFSLLEISVNLVEAPVNYPATKIDCSRDLPLHRPLPVTPCELDYGIFPARFPRIQHSPAQNRREKEEDRLSDSELNILSPKQPHDNIYPPGVHGKSHGGWHWHLLGGPALSEIVPVLRCRSVRAVRIRPGEHPTIHQRCLCSSQLARQYSTMPRFSKWRFTSGYMGPDARFRICSVTIYPHVLL